MSGKHHLLGPSSLPRILNCVGSLYGPYVPDKSSAAAEEGTTCHALLEFCLTWGANPRDMLGSTDFDEKYPITIEMVEGVELFITTATGVCTEIGIDPASIVSEQKLIHPSVPDEMFGGTSDCIIPGDDTLIIMDLKYGHNPVFADSVQLTAYSLLALASLNRTFGRVIQLIVQPRCNPPVSRYEPGAEELTKVWGQITEAAQFVLDNPDMTVPKPDNLKAGNWCKYCRRKAGCKAREQVVEEFVEISTFTNPTDMSLLATPTSDIVTDQLVKYMGMIDVVKDFMKGVVVELVNRASKGEPIPGHKLIMKYGNRAYTEDEEAIRKKVPRTFKGIAAKDITEQSMMSPAKLEKLLKEKGLWAEYKDKFNKLVESKPVGVKLVDARARGEEIRPEAVTELIQAMESSDE